uniref:AI-2E family transporter n=1 Tax=Thermorudis sp. TaxID=1969470 RepID=A0A7C2WAR5_9BACT
MVVEEMVDRWVPSAWQLVLRVYALVLGTVVAWYLLVQLRDLVILFLLSSILAVGLTPLVHRLHRTPIPRLGWRLPIGVYVLLVYLALVVALGLLVVLSLPPLVQETRDLIAAMPGYAETLQRTVDELESQYPWLAAVEAELARAAERLPEEAQRALPRVAGLAAGLVGTLLSTVVVLALTYYLVVEGEDLREYLLRLVPPQHRSQARQIGDEIGRRTGAWLMGQLALGAIVYVCTAIGLLIIGVPYPFLLALVAGVGEVVPLVGPIVGGAVAVTVAAFQSPFHLIATLVFYVVLQQIESNVLAPKILSDAVGISPLTVLLALIAGATLMGVVGAVLAVPVAAALQVLVGELLRSPRHDAPEAAVPPSKGPASSRWNL